MTILDYIKEQMGHYRGVDVKTSQTILELGRGVLKFSVQELAEATSVSTASIIRFCKKLGFTGFPEFKLSLSATLPLGMALDGLDPEKLGDTSHAQIIQHLLAEEHRNLLVLEGMLRQDTIAEAVCSLLCCYRAQGSVCFVGVGASPLVALDFAQKLQRIGLANSCYADADMQALAVNNARLSDLVFAVSYSGENSHAVACVAKVQEQKQGLIALSLQRQSPLGKLVTQGRGTLLLTPRSEEGIRSGASFSRIHQLIVIDILYLCLLREIGTAAHSAIIASAEFVRQLHGNVDRTRPTKTHGLSDKQKEGS